MSIAATLGALSGAFSDNGFGPSLELLTGDFVSEPGSLGDITAELPALTAEFAAVGNFDGEITASLEQLTAALYSPDTLAGSLEPLTAGLVALNGGIGSITAQLGAITSSFAGFAPQDGAIAGITATLQASLSGNALANGAMAGSLRPMQGAMTVLVGSVGGISAALEEAVADFAGYTATNGAMAGTFAPLFMDAIGDQAVTASFRAWAMNTRLGGVTEYTAFPYNSLARYNGAYLAAGADGLVRLAGDTDQGTDIEWDVRTGAMDDAKPGLKRCTEVVLGLRANGPVVVTVWKNDEEFYTYPLVVYLEDQLHQTRIKPGKGLRSRHYKVGLSGTGPSLELDSLQISMPATTRRLG